MDRFEGFADREFWEVWDQKNNFQNFQIEQGIAKWNPAENNNASEDPYKTLFVSRIVSFSLNF